MTGKPPPPYEQVQRDVRNRMAGMAVCHPDRKHRALDLCDPCYQRERYWSDPLKHRAAARKSVQLARLKKRGVPDKQAKKMIELMEAQRDPAE